MKAAQISEYGGIDQIKIADADKPEIGENQVLVEVHAASINPWDVKLRSGAAKDYMPLTFPVTLGGDMAGTIIQFKGAVEGLDIGDKVYGEAGVTGGSGAFAEFATTSVGNIAKMPSNLSFNEAAAIVLTGVSAQQAITEHLELKSGQKILIHGGAGGIGSAAIQLAKHIGAYVATTASGEGLEFVRSLGADQAIDYKTEKFEDLVHNFDAVFDTVSGETYDRSFKVLKKGGVIVSMNAKPNQALMDHYGVSSIYQSTKTNTAALDKLRKYIEDGVVKVHVDRTFPLEQIQAGFEALENGSVKGKVVIEIKP